MGCYLPYRGSCIAPPCPGSVFIADAVTRAGRASIVRDGLGMGALVVSLDGSCGPCAAGGAMDSSVKIFRAVFWLVDLVFPLDPGVVQCRLGHAAYFLAQVFARIDPLPHRIDTEDFARFGVLALLVDIPCFWCACGGRRYSSTLADKCRRWAAPAWHAVPNHVCSSSACAVQNLISPKDPGAAVSSILCDLW